MFERKSPCMFDATGIFAVAFVTSACAWANSEATRCCAYPGSKPATRHKAGSTYQPTDKLQHVEENLPVDPSLLFQIIPGLPSHKLANHTNNKNHPKNSNGTPKSKKNVWTITPPLLNRKGDPLQNMCGKVKLSNFSKKEQPKSPQKIHLKNGNPSARLFWPTKKNNPNLILWQLSSLTSWSKIQSLQTFHTRLGRPRHPPRLPLQVARFSSPPHSTKPGDFLKEFPWNPKKKWLKEMCWIVLEMTGICVFGC